MLVATIAVAVSACAYDATYGACAVHCTDSSGCPNSLTCGPEGLCHAAGAPVCKTPTDGGPPSNDSVDAGTCLVYFGDEISFASATSALVLNVEDFSRTADGSPTPAAFVIQDGQYFFWSSRLTFETQGVNNVPGSHANTIAVGGNTAPTPSTIMSQIDGVTADDAIVATFTAPVAAVAFLPSDDDGTQSYVLEITTSSGSSSFPVTSAQAPFVGVVNGCGDAIISAALVPPTPSDWWRLHSVTFGP